MKRSGDGTESLQSLENSKIAKTCVCVCVLCVFVFTRNARDISAC